MVMQIDVENALRALLPDVALTYLLTLVQEDLTIRRIRLTPLPLALDAVQDIVCVNDAGETERRVFGFPPVRAELTLRAEGDVWMLQLAS